MPSSWEISSNASGRLCAEQKDTVLFDPGGAGVKQPIVCGGVGFCVSAHLPQLKSRGSRQYLHTACQYMNGRRDSKQNAPSLASKRVRGVGIRSPPVKAGRRW